MYAMLKRISTICLIVFTVMLFFHLSIAVLAYAQGAQPAPVFDVKSIIDMAIKAVVPAIWVAVGPVAVAFITAGVNKISTAYVPRPVQVVLSGMVTAVLAGLTGGDVTSGLVQGGVTQTLAATKPSTLLTEPPPPKG